jgi:uncharacterized low-complexity protein
MTHNNRGRVTVALGGNWRLYTNTIPAGGRAIGTVTMDGFDTGALVLIAATGIYVQVNAGAVKSIDQCKSVAAVSEAREGRGGPGRGQGRKAEDGATDVERVTVQLTPAQREKVRQNGGSAWVRGLIDAA